MISERPLGHSRKYRHRQPEPSLEEIKRLFKIAHEKGIEPPEVTQCNPQAEKERKLHYFLERKLEPAFLEVAYQVPGFSFVVGGLDKSRQGPINKLGGWGAGDKAIDVYLNIAARATQLVASRNGSEKISNHLIRVSPTSDEAILVIGGNKLTQETEIEFRDSWVKATIDTDLRAYKYKLEVPYGNDKRTFELDLDAFSKVLTYPQIVTAATFMISKPVRVDPDSEGGFIQEEIRRLENKEIQFYEYLPGRFRCNGELAEVDTQFNESLATMGIKSRGRGTFVEIKLGMQEADAMACLPFTRDDWGLMLGLEGTVGTRKGFAEIFSQLGGMRFLNTFFGKARANRILTPIVKAFEDIKGERKVDVYPVSGGYLQYWIDLPPNGDTQMYIERVIRRRINSDQNDFGHINLGFDPVVSMIDASTVTTDRLRATFILNSLPLPQVNRLQPETLDNMDFMLNFLENISDEFKTSIFDALEHQANGGKKVSKEDIERMELIAAVCDERKGGRRTIRDSEDLLHTLSEDNLLPDRVKSRRQELLEWFPDFANERKQRVHLLLAKKIEEQKTG